ncbi:DUF4135 domain-containing protein [Pseudomonas aeruginosa]|uniref:DUF4135 domain-containing protein n=1 Tax=Pseudomonas aeruginosa TaxID=287 RepID=UPI002380D0CF|nr:DUF4135 domain-containing protein [Pseudomonas aeruginosa]MDE4568687.1 DUF4135 domain-containing protein [Pseudomonas aeruginosa]
MLISALIEEMGGASGDEAGLKKIANSVVNLLQPDRPSHPAMIEGLEMALVSLYKRMCCPLKISVEQYFGGQSSIGLAQWMKTQLGLCPALDRALYTQSQQLIDEFVLVEYRFALDKVELANRGLWDGESELVSTRIVSPDKHHGQHVLKLSFSGLPALYYKPRSGAGAQLLENLSQLLSGWGLKLGAANTLICEGYHWMAEVPYQPVLDYEPAKQFAFNGGVLYAVAYLLNASDLHFENLIASIEGPVVVDCETLCQPRFSTAAAAYLLKRPREEHSDVSSLFLNFDHYGGEDIDYGGLSCVDLWFRADPYSGIQVALSSEQRQLVQHHSRSAVEVDGRRIAPAVEYFETFISGVRRASELIMKRKAEFLAVIPPSSTFRVPLRATRVYAALLAERMSTICFTSYAVRAWQSHIELDIANTPTEFLLAARTIVEQENIDISALDIPVAYARADSTDLLLRDAIVPGVFDLSPLEVVRLRLEKLSDAVVEEQISELRSRLHSHLKTRSEEPEVVN